MDNSHGGSPLQRVDSHFVNRLPPIDPFSQPGTFIDHLVNAALATALFRCWHLIVFFAGWATMVVLLSVHVYNLAIQSTLLTVFGTVLGFIISYRTSSSFERYNEGRRLWSAMVQGSRTLARTIWLHVPDTPIEVPVDQRPEARLRTIIEKKSTINLVEAFSVAVKHYLRGEEGIHYEDLYHLVKFLPAYALPAGRPSVSIHSHEGVISAAPVTHSPSPITTGFDLTHRRNHSKSSQASIPLPNLTPSKTRKSLASAPPPQMGTIPTLNTIDPSPPSSISRKEGKLIVDTMKAEELAGASAAPAQGQSEKPGQGMLSPPLHSARGRSQYHGNMEDVPELLPARSPPKWALFDMFPFSLFVPLLTDTGKQVGGRTGAKLRARRGIFSHNIPLEITFYLSSYISALQQRKAVDVPTINTMLLGLNQLVDSLTGLERILTTPIPFSYSVHLWSVCWVYCLLLPFQLVGSFKYITIPATTVAAFIFFGFLVAGEEIENPFGYDKNDLNLDHFTHNIIRAELQALTSLAPPDPSDWVFRAENSDIFAGNGLGEAGVPPKEWMRRGEKTMRDILARGSS